MFGPFVHGLNRGGLEDIVRNRRLLATPAATIAGGSDGVRAHKGAFHDLYKFRGWNLRPDPSRIFVEFATAQPPIIAGPPHEHAIVCWPLQSGKYLSITISGIYNGAGQRLS